MVSLDSHFFLYPLALIGVLNLTALAVMVAVIVAEHRKHGRGGRHRKEDAAPDDNLLRFPGVD